MMNPFLSSLRGRSVITLVRTPAIRFVALLRGCLRVEKRSQLREHHPQIKATVASTTEDRDYDEMKTVEMKVSLGQRIPARSYAPGPIRVVS